MCVRACISFSNFAQWPKQGENQKSKEKERLPGDWPPAAGGHIHGVRVRRRVYLISTVCNSGYRSLAARRRANMRRSLRTPSVLRRPTCPHIRHRCSCPIRTSRSTRTATVFSPKNPNGRHSPTRKVQLLAKARSQPPCLFFNNCLFFGVQRFSTRTRTATPRPRNRNVRYTLRSNH